MDIENSSSGNEREVPLSYNCASCGNSVYTKVPLDEEHQYYRLPHETKETLCEACNRHHHKKKQQLYGLTGALDERATNTFIWKLKLSTNYPNRSIKNCKTNSELITNFLRKTSSKIVKSVDVRRNWNANNRNVLEMVLRKIREAAVLAEEIDLPFNRRPEDVLAVLKTYLKKSCIEVLQCDERYCAATHFPFEIESASTEELLDRLEAKIPVNINRCIVHLSIHNANDKKESLSVAFIPCY